MKIVGGITTAADFRCIQLSHHRDGTPTHCTLADGRLFLLFDHMPPMEQLMQRANLHHSRVLFLALVLLAGCASLVPKMDPPIVNLVSLRTLPTESSAPRFEIKLRIINPNKQQLDIAGISYSIELLDKELITGVTNDIPPIEGYGEGVVTLNAELQLLELLRLMASLGTTRSEPLEYRFSAKLEFNGFVPTQRLEESGQITLD
jgi:LEA14-like dessication related protein